MCRLRSANTFLMPDFYNTDVDQTGECPISLSGHQNKKDGPHDRDVLRDSTELQRCSAKEDTWQEPGSDSIHHSTLPSHPRSPGDSLRIAASASIHSWFLS